VTAPNLIAQDRALVKRELVDTFAVLIEPLFTDAGAGGLTPAQAERRTWSVMVQLGAMVLTALVTVLCRRETERAASAIGFAMVDLQLRMDRDYFATIKSTFGPIRFPWFAFRDAEGRTQVPARALFPLHPVMRVTEPLLEWEAALATDHPFRKAAHALLFFTHEAVDIEDTTLERHAVLVGSAVPQEWQYRRPEEIRDILRARATRDSASGKPIVYASTDAHALRRFVDDTWTAAWKMSNGIRLWCIDAKTGETVHLGGEYTWGDCREVAGRFAALQTSGHLPKDGDYGDGLLAQVALITDGIDWITTHILPLFPAATLILDFFHVMEHVADVARKLFPKSSKKARQLVHRARKALGMREQRPRAKNRKGPRTPRPPRPPAPMNGSAWEVGEVLEPYMKSGRRAARDRLWLAVEYIADNQHRMNYGELRQRGYQIGSGAMESLHRTASQLRLKRAGCRWTAEPAQALLNLRMLVSPHLPGGPAG
jgi:hypothetical protein